MSDTQSIKFGPDVVVHPIYDGLGELLDYGDEACIENGPSVLQSAIKRDRLFNSETMDVAEPFKYTREKIIGDSGEHVIRFM